MKQLIAFVVSIVLSAAAAAQSKPIKYVNYIDKKKGYIIQHPAHWQVRPLEKTEFFIARPVEEPNQQFRENMNLVTGKGNGMFLVEYIMNAERRMREDMADFKILDGKYEKINGIDCYKMIYVFSGYNRRYMLYSVVYIMLKDDKAYSLTGTALQSTYKRFYHIFETMAKSFRITK